jgi:hypothetical protein
MADQVVIKEFLATLGYRVDESAQRRFLDSITSMSNAVLGLGAGITAAAGAVTAAVANMASSGAQMSYFAQTLNETVSNVDAIVFAWQKLGLAPQQTMHALQSLANMMRTEPGLAGLWGSDKYAGPGSLTQQFEHMGEKFAQMGAQEQRVFRSTFEKYLGPDVINAWMTRGLQAGGGVQEFNIVKRLFHFDPDYFAQQSVQFERAWQSFQLRLNDAMGHAAGPILTRMTSALQGMTNWLDSHADAIIQNLDRIGAAIGRGWQDAVTIIRDITQWFDRLPDGAKRAAEAVAIFMAALVFPRGSEFALMIVLFSKLLDDYQKFQTTGKSDLGIPWDKIGPKIQEILALLDSFAQKVGGWTTILEGVVAFIIGRRFLGPIVGAFTSITAAVTGTTAAAGGLLRALGPIVAAIAVVETFRKALSPETYSPENLSPNSPFWRGMPASEFRKRFPDQPLPPGVVGDQGGNQQPVGGSSIMERIGHVLSYLNPISVAQGAELPGNIKDLAQQMAMLNDHFSEMNENGAGGFGSWATGLGGAVVSNLFGGAGGGGQGESKGVNSPEAIEAVKYFMGRGWSLPQAIGIVANLLQESGLNPGAENSTGHVGVAQWDRPRQMMYQMRTGRPLSREDRFKQYDYVDYEMRHNEAAAGFALGQTGDAASATMAVDRFYERSGGAEIGRRLANARALGSNPNVQNATFTGGNVTQTNNVTINTTADPNAIRSAFDQQHQRQLADLQRNQQGALH